MSAPEVSEDDFLAFWRDHRAKDAPGTKRILGVDVTVPTDLPLGIEDLAEELKDSQDTKDIGRLVGLIFGPDVYEQWKANGITVPMLRVLFAWGMSNGSGKSISFEEAAELVEAAEAAGEGKAPAVNRVARRASSRTAASVEAGRTSSRTSAANTTSTRKKSRT